MGICLGSTPNTQFVLVCVSVSTRFALVSPFPPVVKLSRIIQQFCKLFLFHIIFWHLQHKSIKLLVRVKQPHPPAPRRISCLYFLPFKELKHKVLFGHPNLFRNPGNIIVAQELCLGAGRHAEGLAPRLYLLPLKNRSTLKLYAL